MIKPKTRVGKPVKKKVVKKKPLSTRKKIGKVVKGLSKAYSTATSRSAKARRDLLASYNDYE